MPRRKLARRFEPRYGVSQIALDTESKYVGRELEDQLLQSTTDLTKMIVTWQEHIDVAEAELQAKLGALGNREQLALRCMLARDIWHIGKLFLTFMGSLPQEEHVRSESCATEPAVNDCAQPLLLFKKTLFEE